MTIRGLVFDHLASTTITILLYVGLGALLLLANVWYVRSLINTWKPSEASLIIAPFQIVGQDDPHQTLGLALANMLQSRLAKLGREMRTSAEALEQASRSSTPQGDEPDVEPQVVPEALEFRGPTESLESSGLAEVFAPMDLEIEVGGLQLGGLVAYFQRLLVRDRLLRITVTYSDSKAVVSGFLDLENQKPIWVPTSTDHEEIVNAIAYSMVKEAFSRKNPEVEAFALGEFSQLIEILQEIATLNHRVSAGRSSRDDFAALMPRIEGLAQLHESWGSLKRIAAEVAENAGDSERAVALYRDALRVTRAKLITSRSEQQGSGEPLSDADRNELERRVQDLVAQIENLQAPATPASESEMFDQTDQRRQWILDMMGVDDQPMSGRPKVAILGGLPTRSMMARSEVRAVDGSSPRDGGDPSDAMSIYLDAMIEGVHLIAPRAEILVASTEFQDAASLVASGNLLLQEDPDLLLVSLTSDSEGFVGLLESLADIETPVVHSAGGRLMNSMFRARYEGLRYRLIMVAPTDLDGNVASFAEVEIDRTAGPSGGYYWAPGETVPVRYGEWNEMSGSGPAAALAAGLAARILDLDPEVEKEELLRALRSGSVDGHGGVPLLNLRETVSILGIGAGS